MQTYLEHIVKQSERWDTLAYKYYGNPFEVNRLIDANPQVAFCEELPLGQTIYIPVIKEPPTSNLDMPPWMREE